MKRNQNSNQGPEGGVKINVKNISGAEWIVIEEKFKITTEMECWPYCGNSFNTTGEYGTITWRGKNVRFHRLIYSIFKGEIPDGQLVRHMCNNTLCQNPSHLILGSAYDNMQDKIKAGNSMRGTKHANSKLQESDIYRIHEMWHSGVRVGQIASFLNIKRSTVGNIVNNRSWVWLGLIWDKEIRSKNMGK